MTNKKENPVCLRCSGPMKTGFLVNTIWVEGPRANLIRYFPQWKIPILDQLVPPPPSDDVVQPLESFSITAFRCDICGYLELRATERTEKQVRSASQNSK